MVYPANGILKKKKKKAFCVIAPPKRFPWLPAPSDRVGLLSPGAWGLACTGALGAAHARTHIHAHTHVRARARPHVELLPCGSSHVLRAALRPRRRLSLLSGPRAAPCPSGNRPARCQSRTAPPAPPATVPVRGRPLGVGRGTELPPRGPGAPPGQRGGPRQDLSVESGPPGPALAGRR